MKLLQKASEVDPENAKLWATLGAVQLQIGNAVVAVEGYERALLLGADTPDVREDLKIARSRLHRDAC